MSGFSDMGDHRPQPAKRLCPPPPVRGPRGQAFVRGVEVPLFWGPGTVRPLVHPSARALPVESQQESPRRRPACACSLFPVPCSLLHPPHSHEIPEKSPQLQPHPTASRPVSAPSAKNVFNSLQPFRIVWQILCNLVAIVWLILCSRIGLFDRLEGAEFIRSATTQANICPPIPTLQANIPGVNAPAGARIPPPAARPAS